MIWEQLNLGYIIVGSGKKDVRAEADQTFALLGCQQVQKRYNMDLLSGLLKHPGISPMLKSL